jgi:hypothetical protein
MMNAENNKSSIIHLASSINLGIVETMHALYGYREKIKQYLDNKNINRDSKQVSDLKMKEIEYIYELIYGKPLKKIILIKPIEKPIDKPFEEPIDKPFEEPIDKPFEEPIDKPYEEPINKPFEEPIDKPFEEPIDKPFNKPIDKPIEEPINKPIDKPFEEPIDKPFEEPIDKPFEEPIDKPIDKPFEEPIEEPIKEPVKKLTNKQLQRQMRNKLKAQYKLNKQNKKNSEKKIDEELVVIPSNEPIEDSSEIPVNNEIVESKNTNNIKRVRISKIIEVYSKDSKEIIKEKSAEEHEEKKKFKTKKSVSKQANTTYNNFIQYSTKKIAQELSKIQEIIIIDLVDLQYINMEIKINICLDHCWKCSSSEKWKQLKDIIVSNIKEIVNY